MVGGSGAITISIVDCDVLVPEHGGEVLTLDEPCHDGVKVAIGRGFIPVDDLANEVLTDCPRSYDFGKPVFIELEHGLGNL